MSPRIAATERLCVECGTAEPARGSRCCAYCTREKRENARVTRGGTEIRQPEEPHCGGLAHPTEKPKHSDAAKRKLLRRTLEAKMRREALARIDK